MVRVWLWLKDVWINDPCYAWVIQVDEYCCENAWDDICQLTYNHCENGYPLELRTLEDVLIVYPNPTEGTINIVGKREMDVKVYNMLGTLILDLKNVTEIDLSEYSSGIYNLNIVYNDLVINNKIIKK